MLIVGAKGFAKEVLELCMQMGYDKELLFYDDINTNLPERLFDTFTILKSMDDAKLAFEQDNRFTIGLGNPRLRYVVSQKFRNIGGRLHTLISPNARIGHFGNKIGDGVIVMTGTVITNDITISEGALVNLNCTIGHDTFIGNYSELSPGAHVSGHCWIGEFCTIGTGAVVLPGIKLGTNVSIGAGAVVVHDVESNTVAVGVPARPVRKLDSQNTEC